MCTPFLYTYVNRAIDEGLQYGTVFLHYVYHSSNPHTLECFYFVKFLLVKVVYDKGIA